MAEGESSRGFKGSEGQMPAETQGSVHVEGNVIDSNIIIGNNNVIIIGGKQVAFHTGWFYGHRYGDLDSFTGRAAELDMLNAWLSNDKDNLLMLRALGGFGKSALAWTWFNRVDRGQWQTAVWWSFYEKESGFESFLSETLKHLGVEVKESARQQVNDLLEALHGTNILIVLDGFERLLRQYGRMDAALQSDDEDADIDPSQRDCSSPLTETFLRGLSGAGTKSKVLMTTRLCPRVLESADGKLLKGCRDEALSAFSPEDAVTFFHKEGIAATRAEIIEVCSKYDYHPLSLSLLVGLINKNHEHKGDIVVARNLDIFGDIKTKRHHVLKYAYESLSPERRELLSKISCFRGSMEYATIKKVFDSPDLENSLIDLRERGLLQYIDKTQRYDMHPIVRHYAYDRLTITDRTGAHEKLLDYFEAVPKSTKVNSLEDLTPVIELYHHCVQAGQYPYAYSIFNDRLNQFLYIESGEYTLCIELLEGLLQASKDSWDDNDPHAQAWVLNKLALCYNRTGRSYDAEKYFRKQIALREKMGYMPGVAIGLGNLSEVLIRTGRLLDATNTLERKIKISQQISDQFKEMAGRQDYGLALAYRGEFEESEQQLKVTVEFLSKRSLDREECVSWAFYTLLNLLQRKKEEALESAKRSYQLASVQKRKRDMIRASWLLGVAYSLNEKLDLAEEQITKSLKNDRAINLIEFEANILLDLARLRYAQGDFKDALEKASEALMITERSGYVLQGADVNLFLAQYALEQEQDKVQAKENAETALKLAYCDGPPYYYKVAYEEAERMLAKLK